ncbi:murein L,D-transpeptidase [Shinella sumterensis]|uniref:L,D-transpeptidase family protein n=1 Tax=Shinella sumterensis TaxID=1967501 RepID=UPI00106EB42F|nr:murein L,D-transpeptidase [Shinella sumterensis]MCD1263504.1 L,D-transpeptidase family protein [Shinella sumterensis]MDP9591220.1 murein L,D-transpeptidase YcbB/YkuD [Shinella zoogloeoides]TFE97498.1 peptidoglycan-binding protein [Shinella sumterensis]WLS08154.1 murein L,D-transpeptidase [Shinella sumterensis]
MKLTKTAVLAAALALSCATVTLHAAPANAMTFMEWLQKRKEKKQAEAAGLPGVKTTSALPGAAAEVKQEAKPLPRVTGPRYYTYKADALKRVGVDKLADPVVTSSISADIAPAGDAGIRAAFANVDVRTNPDAAKAVETFYGDYHKFVWIDGTGINDKAKAAIAVLADAASVGLDPWDYAVKIPAETFDSADMNARYAELATFEIALSSAVASYVQDAVRGRIDPNRISGYHDFKRKDVNLVAALKNVSMSSNVKGYLESRSPQSADFQALKDELARLKAETGGEDRVVIADGTLLKPGQSNPELANIVKGIVKHGSDALKTDHSVTIATYAGTPEYTPELVSLVEAFQKEHGLKPDGIVGKASIRLLTGGDSVADKIAKVEVALEQARWLPVDLGARHVFINQPAFQVYYYEGGSEKFSMRTVVGSKSNQTYFFEDKVQTVEVNPYWGVPQSIIINEMLPKLRNDPNYLDRMGYEVAVGGRAVPSSSVNWYGSTSGISVRQPPSGDNALGELKILFPNSHAIYMHDTPSKSFFKKDMRALSHGCVRLAEPRKMAAAVLGVSEEEVGKEIAAGRNKALNVKADIPIYIAYFTAWPNKDGVVEYFDDVYGRDDYMRKAFAATQKARQAGA